jgi:hypothetical protein
LNGDFVDQALEVCQLCVNSFYRLKSFLEEYHDSEFIYPSKFVTSQGDWKDWFLLPKELSDISKYDNAIRAVEFTINISERLAADYDDIGADVVYLFCSKLAALVDKFRIKIGSDNM